MPYPFTKKDFKPGDQIIKQEKDVYTVLDPVRTVTGKLRLSGPRGGYTTTWWTLGMFTEDWAKEYSLRRKE